MNLTITGYDGSLETVVFKSFFLPHFADSFGLGELDLGS